MADRPTAIVASLLVAAFALATMLTWQAATAAGYHRRAAEHAVRDFASIASDEFLRRAANEIEMYGFYPLRYAMLAALEKEWSVPSPPSDPDERLRRALPLVKQRFLFDRETGTVQPQLDDQLATWMRAHLFEAVNSKRTTGEQVLRTDQELIVFGIGFIETGRLFGFTVDERAFQPFLERAFRRSVFPPSLGGGKLTNEALFVEINRDGQTIFRSPGRFEPTFGLTRILGAEYPEVFRGATVRSSIDPAVAPRLVIGGVPSSRVPVLAAVLLLTAILLGAAALLLRRERQLAALRADFVSGVSHELRTPLTQIRMFSETLMLDRVRSDEERKRSMAIIDQEARRLTHLVENVLTFARSERGVLALAPADHDARALICNTIELFTPLARATIKTDVEAETPVHIDGDSFRQVLLNLLENAAKYGPPGQTITVRGRLDDGAFRMEVEDQGPGIPESEREAIWRKFVRLQRDRGTHKAGTGIGLSVVREIVTLHGGRCWVESAPGGGARFVVEVPA